MSGQERTLAFVSIASMSQYIALINNRKSQSCDNKFINRRKSLNLVNTWLKPCCTTLTQCWSACLFPEARLVIIHKWQTIARYRHCRLDSTDYLPYQKHGRVLISRLILSCTKMFVCAIILQPFLIGQIICTVFSQVAMSTHVQIKTVK